MNPPDLNLLPPSSLEAEQGVLGSLLLDPVNGMPVALATIPTHEVFYDLRHRTLWSQMVRIFEDHEPLEVTTLIISMRHFDTVNSAGGVEFISALPDKTPSAANLEYYLKILLDLYQRRQLIQVTTRLSVLAMTSTQPTEDLLNEAERDIMTIARQRSFKEHAPIRDVVRTSMQIIEDDIARQGLPRGIPTGFCDLDRMTSGLENGEMFVLAARPSLGKTSLAMNIAEHVAVDLKIPVGVFSLEMSAESLVSRAIYSRARVNSRAIMDGFFADRDAPKLTRAAGKIGAAPLYIDDTVSGATIWQITARARRLVQMFGVKLFVIDYLQLVHGRTRGHRVTEMTEVSQGAKEMARELNVPVLILSQLNRDVVKEKGRKPRMDDLRDTGSIEQDADKIALLYRPKDFTTDNEDNGLDQDSMQVNMIIAKQRNGPTGEIYLTFLRAYTRFESAARITAADVPDESPTVFDPVLSDPAGRSYI